MKIFTLLILLLLLPVSAWAEATKESVSYIECSWNGSEVTSSTKTATATVVTDQTTWSTGWYVVNSNITINSRVTVTGHVHLILADRCRLTAFNGIEVSVGNSLTIYAQSEGDYMGVLVATGNNDAGIGGGLSNANSGTVTIHGGTVNATSGSGAGIGGGGGDRITGGSDGTVTIYGGEVTARSTFGAGIGGGGGDNISDGSGGTVTIHGGTVTATSNSGAGIGGGGGGDVFGGSDGTVTIHGGEVTAISIIGAGIGGGGGDHIFGGSGGTVTIHGGTVNATSNSGAGIGGGGGNVSSGSGSFSTGTNGNAFIIASSIQDNDDKSAWSGVIFEGDEGKVYGSPITLTTNATIPANKELTVESGKTLVVGEGVTLTNNGTVENNGRIVNKGGTINGVTNYLNPVDLDENMVSLEATPFTYTGDAIEPEVTVSNGNVTYIKGTDYTVSYSDNNIVGTAKVTVTPIDSDQSALLGAAVEKTFTIEKAPATLSFAKETVSATIGKTVENTLTVTPEGVAVSYSSSEETVATVDASTGAITLVGAGETTITATVADPNYQGEAASYTLTVTLAPLGEGEITAEGETNISIEMDGTSFELTAKVTADDLGTNGTWTWASSDATIATVEVESSRLRATTSVTSTAIVTPVSVGTATITATYTDSKYTGSVDFTVTVTEPEPEEPQPPIYQPSYYNIYVEDVCEGVDITTSKNVVREGGSISLYVEKDTANYTFDNFKVYYKRSYYGVWEVLEEGVQPGEYPIRNIWTHIYVKAEGAEEKEDDPTGMEQVEGVKVYTKDGSLYVQTPQREQVIIVSMSGAVVKNEEQIGLKQYHGLQPGIYIVRVGDRAYKLRLH